MHKNTPTDAPKTPLVEFYTSKEHQDPIERKNTAPERGLFLSFEKTARRAFFETIG